MVVAVEGWSEASRYLDKLLLLYDSIRHVGPLLFLLFEKHRLEDSSTGGSHLVNPSIDVEEISKVFLSAFCFRPNMTRGKIRFPFDRRRNDTNGRFADPRATVEGEKVKESEKQRKKKEKEREAEGGERGVDWQMPANV